MTEMKRHTKKTKERFQNSMQSIRTCRTHTGSKRYLVLAARAAGNFVCEAVAGQGGKEAARQIQQGSKYTHNFYSIAPCSVTGVK